MRNSTFIEITSEKFHEFLFEVIKKHITSDTLLTELNFHKFHTLNSFKKDFLNEILNNYYGIHYVGIAGISVREPELRYKLSVTDKKLCTFFLLKYIN